MFLSHQFYWAGTGPPDRDMAVSTGKDLRGAPGDVAPAEHRDGPLLRSSRLLLSLARRPAAVSAAEHAILEDLQLIRGAHQALRR